MWWYAIYQVSSSVQSRTASRVKSRSEGTWAFCSDQQWCGWIGGNHEVNGLTSFWELFCLSKMEGRPPQMRAMSRVLVLGSTILSFQREQIIHVLPARWFEVEWIFSAADTGITDCYCIFHIIVIAFVKESKTISSFIYVCISSPQQSYSTFKERSLRLLTFETSEVSE